MRWAIPLVHRANRSNELCETRRHPLPSLCVWRWTGVSQTEHRVPSTERTAAQAAPVSVGELLSNPDRFRDQPVTVTGTMSNFRENVLRRGTRYYMFDFGGGTQTVRVVSYEKPRCRAGAATVEGTFAQVKWRARVNYAYEEITARNVICSRDHGPKTK